MQHHFDTIHAEKYGIEEAIFINHLQFWIMKNRRENRNFYDGRTWTYNSIDAFAKLCSYMTIKKVRRTIESLISQGVVLAGNYNANTYDRTLWYSFVNEVEFLSPVENEPVPKKGKSISQKGQMEVPFLANGFPEMGKPIPDDNTNNNTDNIFTEKNKKKKADGAKAKDSLWKIYIDSWLDANQQLRKFKPVFTPRDGAHLKGIISALKTKTKAEWNEEVAKIALKKFFTAGWQKDDWLRKNYSLANLYSQINVILNELENGKPKQPNNQSGRGPAKTAGTLSHIRSILEQAGEESPGDGSGQI